MKLTQKQMNKRELILLARVMKYVKKGKTVEESLNLVIDEVTLAGVLEGINILVQEGGDDV